MADKTPSPEKKKPEGIKAQLDYWNAERGFGFFRLQDGRKIFVHVSELCRHLRPHRGQNLQTNTVNIRELQQGNRGLSGVGVECNDCAEPVIWKLVPTGREALGVPQFKVECSNPDTELRSPFSYKDINEANRPYEEALIKKRLWDFGILGDDFFKVFGEPLSIELESEDIVVLSFDIGDKRVSTYELFKTKKWEVTPTTTSTIEETEYEGEIIFNVEFTFPDIPGAKVQVEVAKISLRDPSRAVLLSEFELLPESIQQEIAERIKDSILTPFEYAEFTFKRMLTDAMERTKISEIRKEIRNLMDPRECVVDFRQDTIVERDETYGEHNAVTSISKYYLMILALGVRRFETRAGLNNSLRFHSAEVDIDIEFYNEAKTLTADQLRIKMLEKRRRNLRAYLDELKGSRGYSYDPRLKTMDDEEWQRQYTQRWDDLEKEILITWEDEDNQAVLEIQRNVEEYDSAARDLIEARKEVDDVKAFAKEKKVRIFTVGPRMVNIGFDSIETLRNATVELRKYAAEMSQFINDQLAKWASLSSTGAKPPISETIPVEAPRDSQEMPLGDSGTSGTQGKWEQQQEVNRRFYREIAFSLISDAEKKLSIFDILALFQRVYSAPYGRARRVADIEKVLGRELSDLSNRIYSFSRAKDLDGVLEQAIDILNTRLEEK